MKKTSICFTEYNNHYLSSPLGPYHLFLPPILFYLIERGQFTDFLELDNNIVDDHEFSLEEIKYYYSKYLFLKKHGLLKSNKEPGESKLSCSADVNNIKWRIANLSNLVFEVTENCNLSCKYCGYGEYYNSYEARNKNNMSFKTAKTAIDFLNNLWRSELNHSPQRTITFGFYGGEPLLNIDLIKRIVEYVETSLDLKSNNKFNLTTNGTLLNKYMDYLVSKNFSLLISLDGNESNHSYRVTHNGSNSFKRVNENINLLRDKYPAYFDTNCNFNAVLHNRNSVNDIFTFINNEFGKIPFISEVSSSGINPNMWDEYNKIYKNSIQDIYQSDNYIELASKIELANPDFKSAVMFLYQYSGNFFHKYLDLIQEERTKKFLPTATCFPFERKMFITATGKILPCERIDHKFYLGEIKSNKVELNFEGISLKYNCFYKKMRKNCSKCYDYRFCRKCFFQLKDLELEPICDNFKDQEEFDKYIGHCISFFEKNPEVFEKAINVIVE